jgi:8-oxo-dGTP pyrophosphatase MutT (NUDIX family)
VSSIWHRQTARVLPVDDEGRVLLLHGWDPHHPDRPFWFTIGGAADPGESLRAAGARELYEETRIVVEPERLGEPIAENSIEFSWAHGRRPRSWRAPRPSRHPRPDTRRGG